MTIPWTVDTVTALHARPFLALLDTARAVHLAHFPEPTVQLSTLLSIKTGGCPEDCAYCPQSVHYKTESPTHALLPVAPIVEAARAAQAAGATRFCMGCAWSSPTRSQVDALCTRIAAVKALGLETCVTAGMLEPEAALQLAAAGLDYYNHNLDTGPAYYEQIIHTRTYQARLDTLAAVRAAQIKICCGGIIGMGESVHDRVALLTTLANLDPYPESVPINRFIPVAGTPLGDAHVAPDPDTADLEWIRTIALARILMPRATIRLSAGRDTLSLSSHALCFYAGANSIFYGDRLLTQGNPDVARDQMRLAQLGLSPQITDPRAENALNTQPAACH